MNESPKDRIGRLEEELYSRNRDQEVSKRTPIGGTTPEVNSSWQEEEMTNLVHREREHREHKQGNFYKKLLIGASVFFVLSAVVVAYVYFVGLNQVSPNNISIEILGPTTTAGGAELSLDVTIKNENSVNLDNVTLVAEYPEGTRVAENINTELVRDREPIGVVPAKGQVTKTLKSALFGEKEAIKNIKLTIEYRIQGSSAVYYKDKNYDVAIKSSPVILTIAYPNEVNSNQNFEFVAEIASNSGELLNNLLLETEYPFGFTYVDSNPKPISGNNIWRIGDLPTGEKRIIRIKGFLEGQNEEERTFQFSTGIASEKKDDAIGTNFIKLGESVHIKKPFVGMTLTFDGSGLSGYAGIPGQTIKANIAWVNNLSARLLDMKIEAKITGVALDRTTVSVSQGGFYRSFDNTVVWDKTSGSNFSSIDPGEKGSVSFSFAPLKNIPSTAKNQQIDVSVVVDGSQLLSGIPQSITSKVVSNVKIASALGFSARGVRSIGPFENMGPVPPRADIETTYTVLWDVTNSLNNLRNVRVEGTLPPYVNWTGLTSPSDEKVSFDPITRMVIWTMGDVPAGTGVTSKVREAAFQVTVLPSLSHVGTTPEILTSIRAYGDDQFVGKSIEVTHPALTTRTSTDPRFKDGDGPVVK